MKTLWTLLFWAIMLPLAINGLMALKETHPGYASALGVIAIFAFCAAMAVDKK